uniref:Capsid protein n=1 Tax=Wenling thamnaconus striatus hepevirus TaxID=2116400 RepID=A0A2P1GN79_9VIRU|nr:capsid protein [Wenling thamnaconus striatus hepevirus]
MEDNPPTTKPQQTAWADSPGPKNQRKRGKKGRRKGGQMPDAFATPDSTTHFTFGTGVIPASKGTGNCVIWRTALTPRGLTPRARNPSSSYSLACKAHQEARVTDLEVMVQPLFPWASGSLWSLFYLPPGMRRPPNWDPSSISSLPYSMQGPCNTTLELKIDSNILCRSGKGGGQGFRSTRGGSETQGTLFLVQHGNVTNPFSGKYEGGLGSVVLAFEAQFGAPGSGFSQVTRVVEDETKLAVSADGVGDVVIDGPVVEAILHCVRTERGLMRRRILGSGVGDTLFEIVTAPISGVLSGALGAVGNLLGGGGLYGRQKLKSSLADPPGSTEGLFLYASEDDAKNDARINIGAPLAAQNVDASVVIDHVVDQENLPDGFTNDLPEAKPEPPGPGPTPLDLLNFSTVEWKRMQANTFHVLVNVASSPQYNAECPWFVYTPVTTVSTDYYRPNSSCVFRQEGMGDIAFRSVGIKGPSDAYRSAVVCTDTDDSNKGGKFIGFLYWNQAGNPLFMVSTWEKLPARPIVLFIKTNSDDPTSHINDHFPIATKACRFTLAGHCQTSPGSNPVVCGIGFTTCLDQVQEPAQLQSGFDTFVFAITNPDTRGPYFGRIPQDNWHRSAWASKLMETEVDGTAVAVPFTAFSFQIGARLPTGYTHTYSFDMRDDRGWHYKGYQQAHTVFPTADGPTLDLPPPRKNKKPSCGSSKASCCSSRYVERPDFQATFDLKQRLGLSALPALEALAVTVPLPESLSSSASSVSSYVPVSHSSPSLPAYFCGHHACDLLRAGGYTGKCFNSEDPPCDHRACKMLWELGNEKICYDV